MSMCPHNDKNTLHKIIKILKNKTKKQKIIFEIKKKTEKIIF
jgi:hypothetical protein